MEGNEFIGVSSGRASTPPDRIGRLIGAAVNMDRVGRVISGGLG
jgi:hypothetical protein